MTDAKDSKSWVDKREGWEKVAWVTGIWLVTAIGLEKAGKKFPPLVPISILGGALMVLDDEITKETLEQVKKVNRKQDGSERLICPMPRSSKTAAGTSYLKGLVKEHGGTAWFQSWKEARPECFWYYSKDFVPNRIPGKEMGYIVHGDRDGDGVCRSA